MVPNGGTSEEMASHEELMAEKGFYALYMSQLKGKGPGGDTGDATLEFVST
jgi:hypothetical protein